jgi:hypothetical protein
MIVGWQLKGWNAYDDVDDVFNAGDQIAFEGNVNEAYEG